MKRNLLIILIIGVVFNSFSQIAPDKYYIQFTDKDGSQYSIDNPSEFLTQRAIERRIRQGIEIVENDIPVNANYLQGVADIGIDLLNATKWLNGVTVYTTNPALIEQIEALPYVSGSVKFNYSKNYNNNKFKNVISEPLNTNTDNRGDKSMQSMDYGDAFGQIDQLNGIILHDAGFQGEGMVIAVLDAGFTGAEEHPVLEFLFENDRILGSKDFVYIGGSVYTDSEHGKMVLSCMGGNLPGVMIGTAPQAEYWLLRSEEAPHENIIEEYNWMSAAEFADSVGADVINSSLGYIAFDNPIFDHTHEALNGDSTVVTRAADFAASKGILVVNSAGNSGGSSSFPWIGAPADGDSVFTIGAVNLSDQRASFSSIGPTADGRIKPLVMACGEGATIATGTQGISTWGDGTSFSSPIMAGMATCLWQAHPELSIMEVQEAIKQSGSYASDPNDYMGWGIPNFYGADSILTSIDIPVFTDNFVATYPNPFNNKIKIEVNIDTSESVTIEIINTAGRVVLREVYNLSNHNNVILLSAELNSLLQGVYFLNVITKNKSAIVKIIKE
jgi:subtilisin family serine protease